MFKKVALALAVVLGVLILVVATRPSTFRVERSLTMAATAELPFGVVNDFHQWHHWSPWDALDPKMEKSFSGAYAGPGGVYSWSGNDQVGKGKMTNLEAKPYESVRIRLEFLEPWPSTATTTFLFEPAPEGVTVRWVMEGENDFMGKAMSLLMDMDAMIGRDFEKGLASMKALVEPEHAKRLEMKARREAAAAEEQEAPAPPAQADAPTP